MAIVSVVEHWRRSGGEHFLGTAAGEGCVVVVRMLTLENWSAPGRRQEW
jgi:hypothetical protein